MKKYKKTAKQWQQLQSIYGRLADNSVDTVINSDTNISGESTVSVQHQIIKRDLLALLILIAVMVAVLFLLNYLAETTSFGIWMTNLVGKIL